MSCDCMFELKNDYSIELVQGDYGSFLYIITDKDDNALDNIDDVVFTCSRLKLQQSLIAISRMEFALTFDASTTSKFNACTCTYDVTIIFKGNQSPYTVIHDANFTILKKENKLNDT